jgi:hypothetical protein
MEGDDAMEGQEHPTLRDVPIGIDATGQRHETDSMGGIDVPADRYWGAQTQRSLVHFAIGDDRMPKRVYHAYGYVKKAAALINAAAAPLLFGLRLWASVCLALYVAFWLELENAFWAGTTAAIVCQPHLGASLRKGWYRMIGTLVGAVVIVVLTAWFPQARAPFLVALALWAAACALVATLLAKHTHRRGGNFLRRSGAGGSCLRR